VSEPEPEPTVEGEVTDEELAGDHEGDPDPEVA